MAAVTIALSLASSVAMGAPAQLQESGAGTERRDAVSEAGMVVTSSPLASDVGAAILAEGGNAIDASIAVAFALAVTYPTAGNIGGGGFMLVHPGDGSPAVFIDFREKAPLASTIDMFAEGGSRKNHRYVGVPGSVRGLSTAHGIYGSMAWAELVEPAVRLAGEGFRVHAGLARSLNGALARSNNDEFKRVYGPADADTWSAGERIVLRDLAATLERIRDEGVRGFYHGETARLIAAEMESGGGYITEEDLALYRARVRQPVRFTYRDYEVLSAPPPSSGGITLAQMMQIVEPYELRESGRWSARTNHLMIESMRRGYAERARHLGDADFVAIDPDLASKEFAAELRKSIDLDRATPSREIGPKITESKESEETTHISVMDGAGMAVAFTTTLEAGYGSGVVVRGAGFLLNNEMGDFNPQPGVTNERGRIGTPPNLIAPEKRMLSSMTPTIALRDGEVVLVTGSPGGRTIINTVYCVAMNVLEFGMGIREAVDAPRMDHEWFPDRVRVVRADAPPYANVVPELEGFGHTVVPRGGQGDANSILVKDGWMHGAADRAFGTAAAPEVAGVQSERTPVPEGINDSFLGPDVDVDRFVERWELESREVYVARDALVRALELEEGDTVADIGTGTGLFVEPFAEAVGQTGKVHAVDISPKFVLHVAERTRKAGLEQVEVGLSTARSAKLPEEAVDAAFLCDVYHHFEYHEDMLRSIHSALKPGGTLLVVDFHRIPGVTREWLLGHVRAGQDVFRQEIEDAGFELVREIEIDGFEENYCLRFKKR